MWLDRFTIRNLELLEGVDDRAVSLLNVLDHCQTAMGSRRLRHWMMFPLIDRAAIEQRAEMVGQFHQDADRRSALAGELQEVGDMERIAAKCATGRVNPRELLRLSESLNASDRVKQSLVKVKAFGALFSQLTIPLDIAKRIAASIQADAPVNVAKGGVIAEGVDADLDELRHLSSNAKDLLLELQQRESERTGITSLKVGYNNVFGYYLEVRNTHKDKVPAEWVRKQTLVSAERYVTDELKTLEERILSAEEGILAKESKLYQAIVEQVLVELSGIQHTAAVVSTIDVLLNLAQVAVANDYCRPEFVDDRILIIENAVGGSGDDELIGNAVENKLYGRDGADVLTGNAGNDLLIGGNGNDTLLGGDDADSLYGGADNDTLRGNDGNDRLIGNDGDDVLYGGEGDDILKGRDGNDSLFGEGGNDILFADGGVDTLEGGTGNDSLYGGKSDDVMFGGAGDDKLRGNLNNDELYGGAGVDDLRGGGSNDTLDGGANNDYLFGENGKDILFGGSGDDSLTGGIGSGTYDGFEDIFVFKSTSSGGGGYDRIKDFEDGIDLIDLTSFGFSNFSEISSTSANGGADTKLNFGSGDVLYIENFAIGDFEVSDVILV